MEINVKFSKYLNIYYLYSLAKQGCKDEFMRFYHSAEGYLEEIARETSRVDVLTQIQSIIAYRTMLLEKII